MTDVNEEIDVLNAVNSCYKEAIDEINSFVEKMDISDKELEKVYDTLSDIIFELEQKIDKIR
jgi:prefoldin subunit 5